MDKNPKPILKNVAFFFGAIILIIILYRVTAPLRQYNHIKQPEKPAEILHEKSFGDLKLTITAKEGDKAPKVLLNMSRRNKAIVENYLLPTHENGFDYVRFEDSFVVTAEPGKYHIMLFTAGDELEHSPRQIWFLSFDGSIKVVRVDDLLDMRRSKSDEGQIIGSKYYRLPYIGNYYNNEYVIPVEIIAHADIKVTPLLNYRGISLLRTYFKQDVAYINNELSKFPDQSTTDAARNRAFVPYAEFTKKLSTIQKEFNETLNGSTTFW